MTLKFVSDVAGGRLQNENGVDVLKVDANGRVTFDAYGGLFTTGDFKQTARPTAPTGWVAGDGGTIGNVGSGATRANVDTLDLFTLWWQSYTDAQLPILTSTGSASTRGPSAAADWAAGKRLTVFNVRGRFIRNADGGTLSTNGTMQEGSGVVADGIGDTTLRVASNGSGVSNGEQVQFINGGQTYIGGGTFTGSTGQRYVKVRPDNLGLLGCFKL